MLTKAGYSEAFESLSSAVCIYEDGAQRARREGLGSLGFGDPTGGGCLFERYVLLAPNSLTAHKDWKSFFDRDCFSEINISTVPTRPPPLSA